MHQVGQRRGRHRQRLVQRGLLLDEHVGELLEPVDVGVGPRGVGADELRDLVEGDPQVVQRRAEVRALARQVAETAASSGVELAHLRVAVAEGLGERLQVAHGREQVAAPVGQRAGGRGQLGDAVAEVGAVALQVRRRHVDQVVQRAGLVRALRAERHRQLAQRAVDVVEFGRVGGALDAELRTVGQGRAVARIGGRQLQVPVADQGVGDDDGDRVRGQLYLLSYSMSTRRRPTRSGAPW